MRYLTIIFLFIATFATGQQQMFLRSTPAGGGVAGILDSFPSAATAYATSLLYGTYSGSCLRVRRDSDNTEQDIGFSGQDIDQAAISAFCSGANCFVTNWYDQSGAGNNATQATAGNQPKIYDSSTGIIYNNAGNVAIHFVDNSNNSTNTQRLILNVFHAVDAGDIYAWTVQEYGAGLQYFPRAISSSTNFSIGGYFTNTKNVIYTDRTGGTSSVLTGPSMTVGLTYLTANYANRITIGTAINGGAYSTASDSNTDFTGGGSYAIGGDTGGASTDILLTMIVFYDSDQSANRASIESAINNYFNIFYINILILLVRLPKRKEKNPA